MGHESGRPEPPHRAAQPRVVAGDAITELI